jgi:hypothetical protein
LDESARSATLAAGGGRETLGACAKNITTTKVQAAPAAKAAMTLGQERLGAAGAAKIRESCGEASNSEDIGMPPGGLSVSPPFVCSCTNSTRQKAARFLLVSAGRDAAVHTVAAKSGHETFSATGCCDRPGTSKWKNVRPSRR